MKHRKALVWLAVLIVVSVVLISTSSATPPATEIGIDTYVRQLEDRSPRVRYDAIEALGRSKDLRALDALIGAMKSDDEDLRHNIVRAIGRFGSPKAVDALLAALQDPSDMVSRTAVEGLAKIDGIVDRLAAMLTDSRPSARISAAGALVHMKDVRGVEPILAAIRGTDPDLRRMAVQHLGMLWVPDMANMLLGLMKDPDPRVRTRAAEILGRCGDPRAFDVLSVAALDDESEDVRFWAVQSLSNTRDPKVIPIMIRIIKSGGEVPVGSSDLAYGFDSPDALPYILEGLKDRNVRIRILMLDMLERIDDPVAREAILGALQDKNPEVRRHAQELIDIRNAYAPKPLKADPTQIPALLRAIKGMDDNARDDAIVALSTIGGQQVIDGLVRLLADPKPCVWDAVGCTMSRMNDPSAVPQVTAYLAKGGLYTVAAARVLQWIGEPEPAVKPLIKLLSSPNADVRRKAIHILGDMRCAEALQPIIGLLKDPKVRNTAIVALGLIGGPKSANAILPYLKPKGSQVGPSSAGYIITDSGVAARALAQAGDKSVVPTVIALLKDRDPAVRSDAIWLLGRLGDTRAVDPLIPLLKDSTELENGPLCAAAARVLGRLGDRRAVPALIELAGGSGSGAFEAVQALGEIRDPRTVDMLIGLSRKPGHPDAVRTALGRIGDQRCVERLLEMLNSPFPDNWRSTAEALGNLGVKSAADRLFAIKDVSPEAIFALGRLKDPRVFDTILAKLIGDCTNCPRDLETIAAGYGDARVVEPLIKRLSWEYVDVTVIDALGKLGDKRAVGPLIGLLKRADRIAAQAFISSLEYNADAPPEPNVVWMESDPRDSEYRPRIYTALTAITGQNFGNDTKAWVSWWESQDRQKTQ